MESGEVPVQNSSPTARRSRQKQSPTADGTATARSVCAVLPVSRRMVRSVVAHGEWKSTSRHTDSAVIAVQPFAISSVRKASSEERSVSEDRSAYMSSSSGITSSLAGSASRNAVRITPSSPKKRPIGSKKPVSARSASPSPALASSQMSTPAGSATQTARRRTRSVRSSSERTSTRPICGTR